MVHNNTVDLLSVLHNNSQDMGKELMAQQYVGNELQACQGTQCFLSQPHCCLATQQYAPMVITLTGVNHLHLDATRLTNFFHSKVSNHSNNDICQSTIPCLLWRQCLHRMIIFSHIVWWISNMDSKNKQPIHLSKIWNVKL